MTSARLLETSNVAMFRSKASMTAAVLELNPALHTDSTKSIFSMGKSSIFHVTCYITDFFAAWLTALALQITLM